MAIMAAQRAAHDAHKKTAIGEADGCFFMNRSRNRRAKP
jgi:hypothetical protein